MQPKASINRGMIGSASPGTSGLRLQYERAAQPDTRCRALTLPMCYPCLRAHEVSFAQLLLS